MIDENLRQETKENAVNNGRNNKNSPVSLGRQNPRNVCKIALIGFGLYGFRMNSKI
jgi:hypothetical protein